MVASVGETITQGFLPWAMLLAFAGGVVSFASPCVLPLVPGFLGYITGLGGVEAEQPGRCRLVLAATLFVLGFTVVFLALGVVVSSLSLTLAGERGLLLRLGGLVVLVMGAIMTFGTGGREWRLRWRPAAGLLGAPLLGAAFGVGFSACIGPVLAAILTLSTSLSGSSEAITRGTVLAAAYSLGLGLPFVLVAAGWGRLTRAFRWMRDRHHLVSAVGGVVLMVLGVLMLTGVWDALTAWMQREWTSSFRPVI
ncbi:cytochrome c-type biogenesis protein [Kytococcus aerolatus]|uniref:Cytochrome c-type biogenesis protein n=1 Tax=Kytococcus aerolatus TaxID=592308 RepID=A0A212TCY6_9MICO|nr:cytochrome c biogenesis CcdA family protein [Kytococcus aerolatus]SNC63893.1 cytochrome c-type biogenesis protein [Kytococcus aerolatus]